MSARAHGVYVCASVHTRVQETSLDPHPGVCSVGSLWSEGDGESSHRPGILSDLLRPSGM